MLPTESMRIVNPQFRLACSTFASRHLFSCTLPAHAAQEQTSARWKCLEKIGRVGADPERGCAGEWNGQREFIARQVSILSTVELYWI